MKNSEFLYTVGQNLVNKKRNVIITNRYKKPYTHKFGEKLYTQQKKFYDYHCNICNADIDNIDEQIIKKGNKCLCCSGYRLVKGINDVATLFPDKVKYFQGGLDEASQYTKGTHQRIYPICPRCKRVSSTPQTVNNIIRNGFRCVCGDGCSYPEKFISNILEQLKVSYIYQASKSNTDWINNTYRYDFYIPSIQVIIEADGRQHKDVNAWGKSSIEVQNNDFLKERYALNNGIKIIRVDCSESNVQYISSSIKSSDLQKFFDLSKINYDTANKFALRHSLLLDVCEYSSDHDILTTGQIAKVFNISSNTVCKYLKIGHAMGICNYIPNRKPPSSIKQRNKAKERFSKPVYQFDMKGVFIRQYNSLKEAAKK